MALALPLKSLRAALRMRLQGRYESGCGGSPCTYLPQFVGVERQPRAAFRSPFSKDSGGRSHEVAHCTVVCCLFGYRGM